jgi:hypothetical protein
MSFASEKLFLKVLDERQQNWQYTIPKGVGDILRLFSEKPWLAKR